MPKTPFSEEKSHKNQEEMLRQMGYYTLPAPDRSMWGHAALKDVLKEFMILSTWNSANFAEVSRLWVENAANFMLQAVLEAYRCHGASELDAVNECFSWGRTEIDATTEDIEEVVINEMFSGDSGEISAEFEGVKKEILVGVCLPFHIFYHRVVKLTITFRFFLLLVLHWKRISTSWRNRTRGASLRRLRWADTSLLFFQSNQSQFSTSWRTGSSLASTTSTLKKSLPMPVSHYDAKGINTSMPLFNERMKHA